jgi:lysine biosynthesis protein LysW
MKAKKKPNTRLRASCPDCGAAIFFDGRPELDDEVVCDECESSLIVVRLNPLKLDWAYDDDHDDGDYDDWDDDDGDDNWDD